MPSREVKARDAGLALVSRINRWLIAGAVGLAGLLSLVAAHAFHGHTAQAATGNRAAPQSQSPAPTQTQPQSEGNSGNTGNTGAGLQAPAQAPAPAPAGNTGASTSGGS